jgi:catechol 2,3-dioxygenase-like lactoylglutathione lyase family enzyme
LTQGIHHAGLTVPDLERATRFFREGLGFDHVGEVPDYPAVFLSDGSVMLTLWQADENSVDCDRRKNAGLHHLALKLADGVSLDQAHARLAGRDDVVVEFSPEPLKGTPISHMMFTVDGNIRLELIAA